MDWCYIFKHLGGTLILAPLLSQFAKEIGFGNPREVVGLLEVFPLTLSASIVLSIPTLFTYLFVYHVVQRWGMKIHWIKLVLIIWTICGISLTLYLLCGSVMLQISVYYMIASAICRILIKMKRKQVEPIVV